MQKELKEAIERTYGVSYVGFYDLPDGREHIYVFYQQNPKTELGHTHYMGYFKNPITLESYVTDASSITEAKFNAIELWNGNFLVSRFRHDYRELGGIMIDGGLDYTRYNPNNPPTHTMTIVDGKEIFTKGNIWDEQKE